MQSRRDHLQAYQFATDRLASALVTGDPASGENPMRRATLGMMFGVVIVVLLAAGSGVYGLLSPGGNTGWRQPGSIIVEKETGNRYLFLGGRLHPVVNYASALLAMGDRATVRMVSRNSLAGVPHGGPVGFSGAPDSIPQASALLSAMWARCVLPGGGAGEVVDFDPARRTTPVPADRRILLVGPKGRDHVLWQGVKYPVDSRSALVALGLDTQDLITAPADWLAVFPTGHTLAPARVPQEGRAGPRIAGRAAKVGRLFRTTVGGGDHHYVLLSDGVAPISATESALLAARKGATAPERVSPADIAAAPASSDRSLMNRVPDVLDAAPLATRGAALCLRQRSTARSVDSEVVLGYGPAASGGPRVLVPPGRGVLAVDQAQLSRGTTAQRYLITDQGVKYPLADDSAARALGYGSARTLVLPERVLALVPQGARLARPTAAVPGGH